MNTKKQLRVLVGCEFSGTVRQAFAARGWDAWSCDLLDTEIPGQHIVGDVFDTINSLRPDLLIAHPPCTYLCNSGVRWLMDKDEERAEERWRQLGHAAEFFKGLWTTQIKHVAIENPVMHGHAAELIFNYRRSANCSTQPWEHGHGEVKRTCWWTQNLPPLKPSNIVEGREPRVHHASPGPNRWKERSRTLPGVAKALADQWGTYLEELYLK